MSGWALGLACICAVLFTGQGGWLKRLLELPFWSVAARLTFSTYLVHPMTIWVILGSRGGQPYHFSLVGIFADFVCFSTMSLIAAVVFYFVVEGPFGEVEKWVFKGRKGPSKHVFEEKGGRNEEGEREWGRRGEGGASEGKGGRDSGEMLLLTVSVSSQASSSEEEAAATTKAAVAVPQ
jgi:hypothetical protein